MSEGLAFGCRINLNNGGEKLLSYEIGSVAALGAALRISAHQRDVQGGSLGRRHESVCKTW